MHDPCAEDPRSSLPQSLKVSRQCRCTRAHASVVFPDAIIGSESEILLWAHLFNLATG